MSLLKVSLILLTVAVLVHSLPGKNLLLSRLKRQAGYSSLTRDLWGPSGSFQSLNYPSNYPDNAQWTYIIHTQPGTFITLRYNVSIEAHPSCAWDKLTFDDDYNNLICGTLAGQRTYQVPDSDFVVRFASDSSVQGPGFQISYVITNSSGSTGFGNFSTTYQPSYNSSYQPVYNSTTGYPYYTNSTGYPYYTNSTGYPYYTNSTGYPYYTYSTGYPYYTNSTSYPYYTYSTGYPYYTNSTSYPYYTNSTGYPYYTNSTGYPYYTNSTGYPYYTNSTGYPYYTNSTGYPYYTNSTGYPYNTTDQGYSFLTRDFWGPSGSFQSLNYPSYYPDNAQWTYIIHTQPGTFITLRYNVSIEANSFCSYDKLTFDDDYNNLICGTQAGQRTYQVYDSDFVVRFISDSSVQGPGFEISYVITNSSGSGDVWNYNSTTGYPYYNYSTGYPYYTNSTGYPSYNYSTGYPYYTNSTGYPYYTNSTGYPYYNYSTGYPYYTNSTGYPYNTTNQGVPIQAALGEFEDDLNELDQDIDNVRNALNNVNNGLRG